MDDEEDIVLYFQTALEDAGYEALTASNVPEGLELIRREKPDLVCLDILMPRESGMSLYQKLRSDPELGNIPILITSGLSLSKELKDINYRDPARRNRIPGARKVLPKSPSRRRSSSPRCGASSAGTMTTTTEIPAHVHNWIGRELFQHVPSNIIVIDRDFRVVTANSNFVDVFR